MAYMEKESLNIGKQVKVGPNTQGTGKVGVPSGLALSSRDKEYSAVENPTGTKPVTSKGRRGPADLKKGAKAKNYNRFE